MTRSHTAKGAAPLVERSGRRVSTFLSALGPIRETRLTAAFGYLLGRFGPDFLPLLGVDEGDGARVFVEETEGDDRFDVLVVQSRGRPIIIEGKLGIRQSPGQLARYVASQHKKFGVKPILVVLDAGSAGGLDVDYEVPLMRSTFPPSGGSPGPRCARWQAESRRGAQTGNATSLGRQLRRTSLST